MKGVPHSRVPRDSLGPLEGRQVLLVYRIGLALALVGVLGALLTLWAIGAGRDDYVTYGLLLLIPAGLGGAVAGLTTEFPDD